MKLRPPWIAKLMALTTTAQYYELQTSDAAVVLMITDSVIVWDTVALSPDSPQPFNFMIRSVCVHCVAAFCRPFAGEFTSVLQDHFFLTSLLFNESKVAQKNRNTVQTIYQAPP